MVNPADPSAEAERPEVSSGRVPDFFIVGHRKSGTSALYSMLKRHPQVFMPDVKEPRFFAPEFHSRFRDPAKARRSDTLEGYMELFEEAQPGQLVGEATPSYLLSETAAARIAEFRPDARIVAILREPASFLRSLHLQWLHSHTEDQKSFARAIALEDERRQGRHIPKYSHNPAMLMYRDHVRYVEQIRRFHEAFGQEQVLVLIYEDYRADNEGTVRDVLRFLGLDDTVPVAPAEAGGLEPVRSQSLHRLSRWVQLASRNPSKAGPAAKLANALIPGALRGPRGRALYRRLAFSSKRPADEQLMLELRRGFKGEVVALSEYLGRDMVARWGYDKLD
jgi:Sulfotransferase family